MKRYILLVFSAIAIMMFGSCQKSIETNNGYGSLSFEGLSLDIDESVVTKAASQASGTYLLLILDSEGREVYRTHYSEVLAGDNKLSLKSGSYTIVARSTDEEIPAAVFNNDIYGATRDFIISAGQVTKLEDLVCTLQQCKVTVSYSDDFLASVTGNSCATVTVTEGYPLEYNLTYTPASDSGKPKCSYEQLPGYFAVDEGSTMTVVFSGSIDGKIQKMTKTFSGIEVRQWRQIKFVHKVNEEGTATFDIVIDDLISDAELNSQTTVDPEQTIGEDPNKPKGDGGITLVPDYDSGCDVEITDLQNIEIVPESVRKMNIIFNVSVPNGIKKFTVDISSTNATFADAVALAKATHLDLINPSEENMIIFDVVPFPYGAALLGSKEKIFNLSNAQGPILSFPGTHTFVMNITDENYCTKSIVVKMLVK